jgi:hypothetical protein
VNWEGGCCGLNCTPPPHTPALPHPNPPPFTLTPTPINVQTFKPQARGRRPGRVPVRGQGRAHARRWRHGHDGVHDSGHRQPVGMRGRSPVSRPPLNGGWVAGRTRWSSRRPEGKCCGARFAPRGFGGAQCTRASVYIGLSGLSFIRVFYAALARAASYILPPLSIWFWSVPCQSYPSLSSDPGRLFPPAPSATNLMYHSPLHILNTPFPLSPLDAVQQQTGFQYSCKPTAMLCPTALLPCASKKKQIKQMRFIRVSSFTRYKIWQSNILLQSISL